MFIKIRFSLLKLALGFFIGINCNSAIGFDIYVYASNKAKPDFEKLGIQKSIIIYEQKFYQGKDDRLKPIKPLNLKNVINEIKQFDGDIVHIDIEAWLGSGIDIHIPQDYIDRYAMLVTELRRKIPAKQFGYYDVVPTWAHWNIASNPLLKASWLLENKRRQKIADAEDIIYPCIYTYHDNYVDWEVRANLILKEAKRMAKGKKVIPYLWPRFTPLSPINENNAGKYIPRDYWKKQLNFISRNADGVVVWNDDEYGPWVNNAHWWLEVQALKKATENIKQ